MKSKRITRYGQQILDTICDVVAERLGIGFFGWTLGKTADVVAYVAGKIGKPIRSVAGALSDLVEKGYLDTDSHENDLGQTIPQALSISQAGWKAYSRWNPEEVLKAWGMETLDEWEQYECDPGGLFHGTPFLFPLRDDQPRS